MSKNPTYSTHAAARRAHSRSRPRSSLRSNREIPSRADVLYAHSRAPRIQQVATEIMSQIEPRDTLKSAKSKKKQKHASSPQTPSPRPRQGTCTLISWYPCRKAQSAVATYLFEATTRIITPFSPPSPPPRTGDNKYRECYSYNTCAHQP